MLTSLGVAGLLGIIGTFAAVHCRRAARDATDTAFAFALPVTAAGFWLFVLRRRCWTWDGGWLPEIRL
jgi:hypothetical protein